MSEAEKKQAGAQQGQAGGAQPAPAGKSSPDEKNMATLAHVLTLFTGFIGPLVIWLLKKDQSDFVDDQGKEALNFGISIAIYSFASWLSIFVLIGFLLLPAVLIFALVNIIRGAIAASKGERFRYPLCIRLIK
jgi:uncharacterized Tic20 family protein